MAPANKKSQYVKALSLFTYTRSEDGSPLRPSEPLLQTMYYRDLKTWVHKQDPQFPEFIEYGYVSIKGVTYVSSHHMATDYVNNRLPGGGTFDQPSPLMYTRSASVSATYAATSSHAEVEIKDLHKLNIQALYLNIPSLPTLIHRSHEFSNHRPTVFHLIILQC